jgi:hypothetical protein
MIESASSAFLIKDPTLKDLSSAFRESNTVVENIKCFVRCRPLNDKERDLGVGCLKINEDSNSILVENKTESKNFENKPFIMDSVFSEGIDQDEIFSRVAVPVLKGFLQGFNCTIFAYGQTGAGKTHTMMGPLEAIFDQSSTKHGLIPRILHYIFNENSFEIKTVLKETSKGEIKDVNDIVNLKIDIKCSCLEIYQEQIIDLLNSSSATAEEASKLKIMEDSKRGMFIDGLTEMPVKSDKAAKEIIMLGLKNRHVAATNMNAESSRSHLIFTIFMNLSYTQDESIITRSSRLHLIDLAGSERQKATKAVGERIKEAGMINKSLSTLGNVINALCEMSEGKTKYVPFRDSKLTYFLKDSLGGNAKTTIIANISQSVIQLQETLSTLKFVQRAKMIKNKAVINENVNDTVKILQFEIKKLKEELNSVYNSGMNNKLVRSSIASFICQICKNSQNESDMKNPINGIDLSSSELNSPTSNFVSEHLQNNMNIILSKIENLFSYENTLIQKFRLIDPVASSSIENFFHAKEIYESDFTKLIEDLKKKLKQLNNMITFKEILLNEIKEELNKFKKDDLINNLFVEKINSFIDELLQFKSDFEVNDLLSLTKLKEENRQLKNEIEAMRNLKEYYQSKDQNNSLNMSTSSTSSLSNKKTASNNKVNDFYDKQNMEKINKIVNEFIESNKTIKLFFQENFGMKTPSPYDDLPFEEESPRFTLISKKEYEKINFQLEELKINEENNLKIIDELQSETFLLNMELAKFKEGLNIGISEELHHDLQHDKDGPVRIIDIKTSEFGDMEHDVLDSAEENLNENKKNSIVRESIISQASQTSNNHSPKNENRVKNGSLHEIIFSTPLNNIVPANSLNNFPETEDKNSHTFLKNLRKSLLNSPNKSLMRSSLLYSANQNNAHSHRNSSVNTLTRENLELVRLKEKLDDALINLEEKNLEVNDKSAKIEELNITLDLLKQEIDNLNMQINQLKEENETLFDSNNLYLSDLQELNDKLNLMANLMNENLEVNESLKSIETLSEEMFKTYVEDMDKCHKISLIFSKLKNDNIKLKSSILKLKLTEDENSRLKFENEKIATEKLQEVVSSKEEYDKIKQILNIFNNNQIICMDVFSHNISERLEFTSSKLKKIENILTQIKGENLSLKIELDHHKTENMKFRSKIKEIYGENYDPNNFLNFSQNDPNSKFFNWDKMKLNKIERKILELKEEKKSLKADICLLQADFNKGLSEYALNNKIELLMRVKAENYNLKMQMIEIKKKNDILEKSLSKLQEMTEHTGVVYNPLNNTNEQSISSSNTHISNFANFEEIVKIKREHKELIDKINDLDIKFTISRENRGNKFAKAMEILKQAQEFIDSNKFLINSKFKDDEFSMINSTMLLNKSLMLASNKNVNSSTNVLQKDNSYPALKSSLDKINKIVQIQNGSTTSTSIKNNQLNFVHKTPVSKKLSGSLPGSEGNGKELDNPLSKSFIKDSSFNIGSISSNNLSYKPSLKKTVADKVKLKNISKSPINKSYNGKVGNSGRLVPSSNNFTLNNNI